MQPVFFLSLFVLEREKNRPHLSCNLCFSLVVRSWGRKKTSQYYFFFWSDWTQSICMCATLRWTPSWTRTLLVLRAAPCMWPFSLVMSVRKWSYRLYFLFHGHFQHGQFSHSPLHCETSFQAGIKEVIYYSDKHAEKKSTIASKRLLDMAGWVLLKKNKASQIDTGSHFR